MKMNWKAQVIRMVVILTNDDAGTGGGSALFLFFMRTSYRPFPFMPFLSKLPGVNIPGMRFCLESEKLFRL